MYWGSVYVLSGDTDSIIRKIPIDHNPNTIALTSDGSVLFISTRGPNHPETYLRKGPRFGKIYVMDTATFELQDWIWGKNQPTGLALSPDNRFMAYSNFLDASLEVYWTGLN
jgi:DNA-binding beta-propeller fold protein YncE